MDWFSTLFTSTDSVVHIALLYALVISVGIYLGKLKLGGISLGVTFVLFAGIVAGHFGFTGTPAVLTFMQDFGLILFVYCIGLQVGPGFFESFKKGGVQLNILAVSLVALNIIVMLACFFIAFEPTKYNLAMMVGTLCGAITNTPGLGSATEALTQVFADGNVPAIANGYACAYPLGVVGIILSTIALRFLCGVNLKKEEQQIEQERAENPHAKPHHMTLVVQNKYLDGKTILQLRQFLGREYVCTRLLNSEGHVIIPNRETVVHLEDKLLITCAETDAEAIIAFIGPMHEMEWEEQDVQLVSRNILVTKPDMNGKTFGSLHFSSVYGVNVTRILRADMELFADRNLRMQVGDKIVVVGPEDAVERVAKKMGNSVKSLAHPNMEILFIGIVVGLIFGALPISIPGMPTPVKLGLAGGPLCIAILLGKWGYKFRLVTYMSTSANLLLREVGLVLFLASVGIKAGATFVDTVVAGDGLKYVVCGFIITVLPILIVGIIGRKVYKINYFTLMGMIAGSTTDPPALAFANQTAGNDAPAVGYSTVYPLTMFLRILTAQVIILLLCALL
ncbi:MAG: putative transporter [Bacteroidaceae bacterium]|nr:putative transporter [Bacteroidaceae bacterium]